MKRNIAILVGVLALVASSAFAGSRPQWIAINGGAAFPSSDMSDAAGTGWLAGGSYGLSLNPKIAIGADVNYYGFGKKTVQSIDVQPKTWQYTAAGYYMFQGGGQSPYAKVGLGAYSVDPNVASQSTKTVFGWNAGLGYNKPMANKKTSFGLDATYHWLSQNDEFRKVNDPNSKAQLSFFSAAAHVSWGLGGM